MKDEALKLALDALENSVDLVREDAYNAEKLYGNYPSRQGKVAGLKVLADDHEKAITAINEALAQPEQEPAAIPEEVRKVAQAMKKDGYRGPLAWAEKVIDFVADYTPPAAQRRDIDAMIALARAAERNKVAEWMIAQGYATGHGETIEDLLKELDWQVRESEREACAVLCDQLSDSSRDLRFGAAIRARGQA